MPRSPAPSLIGYDGLASLLEADVEFVILMIPFLDRALLVQNKRATARPKDLLNVELLGGQ